MLTVNPREYLVAGEALLREKFVVSRAQFEIPYNQRPWSWANKQLDALWKDFAKTLRVGFDNESSPRWKQRTTLCGYPHFFGTFLVVDKGAQRFEVFDGQQRLTALCMLAAHLRDKCDAVLVKARHKRSLRAEVEKLKFRVSRWVVDEDTNHPRITPDSEFASLFRVLISDSTGEKERQKKLAALSLDLKRLPRHRKLYDGFYHVKALMDEFLKGYSEADSLGFLSAAVETLNSLFTCVWVTITKEPYAYEVFGCLNARGAKLTGGDNVKNELFIVSEASLHLDIAARWREMVKRLDKQEIGEFLRRRYIGLYGDCGKEELFEKYTDREICPKGTPADIDALTKNWVKDAERLSDLLAGKGLTIATKRIVEDIFETLQISIASIPLLSAARRYLPGKEKEFREICKAVLNYIFRELTIGKRKTPQIEERLGHAARLIGDKTKTTSDVKAYLASKSTDSSFEKEFKRAVEQRTKVQFYILYEIERQLAHNAGMAPYPHGGEQHIEHILPKKLASGKRSGEWTWARSNASKHKAMVNRLGNLLILDGDKNRDVSNFEFSAKQTGAYPSSYGLIKDKAGHKRKRSSYKDSTLHLAKDLADVAKWSTWDESAIDRRQDELANYAKAVWKI